MPEPLPIDALLPAIAASFHQSRNLVIEAPPGAGKTTRVPPAMLAIARRCIYVLEPRRLAARMAARRVAAERGEALGETVGYQVRFEEVAGPRTRLKFVTEGVLTRKLLSEPELDSADIVILDEFHERHLDGDLALALLRRLQLGPRPDLRLVVMSATLDAAPIARYLDGCPVLRSEGRLHPVSVGYAGYSHEPLEEQVARAIQQVAPTVDGHILVFLPGAAEIRRAARACESVARQFGLSVAPLHGDLSSEEQDRAVQPSKRRKLILSTNVAESSITIDGVTVVIDSGLARVATDSPLSGLPALDVRRVSQASARQRAGRAGRTQPGHVIRLYSAEDFARRPAADAAEIQRRELSGVLLELRALKVENPPWFEAPPEEALSSAAELLDRLGAAQHQAAMARLPVHPRIARMLVESESRGVTREACAAAALISGGERRESPNLLDALDRGQGQSNATRLIERRLLQLVRSRSRAPDPEQALSICVLAAYPDRVARRRSGPDVQLSNGRAAVLPAESGPEFMTVIELEERSDRGAPQVRLYCPLNSDWLLDLFPERFEERTELNWNRSAERVESIATLFYDEMVVDRTIDPRPESPEVSAFLAQKAIEAGIEKFVDAEELESLLARAAFASEHGLTARLERADVESALQQLASGLNSFSSLRQLATQQLLTTLKLRVPRLDDYAPERLQLRGRQIRVRYAAGQPPWIASRLQDFFGLREGPRIANGKVPVLIHLLAPNQRPVQMTTDLAGFWQRLYPQVRKELSRRYPKHKWPEDPLG